MMRFLALAFLLCFLQALPGRGDPPLDGAYSAQALVSGHPHHVVLGHVLIVTRGGDTARALVLRHRDDGVHRLLFTQAWAGTTRLPFRAEAGLGCTHGHCRDRALGLVLLSAALFDRAAVAGLSFRLSGPSGTLDITAPPTLFRQAAARAQGP